MRSLHDASVSWIINFAQTRGGNLGQTRPKTTTAFGPDRRDFNPARDLGQLRFETATSADSGPQELLRKSLLCATVG